METALNINEKDSNLVSRNAPVALIVGAAGFIGSHLSEQLLNKNIQVIGVDDFSSGKKENLKEIIKSSKFHLIEENAGNLVLNISRVDYIFVVSGSDWSLQKLLALARKFKSKIVFVSSIELYEKEIPNQLKWFRQAEKEVAGFAGENKINARILRIAAVFGPRMNFRTSDPMVRLIKSTVLDNLQKESLVSDFSSRAIYISDAVSLIIKSMFAGATAGKIFDGALPCPIKTDEIKQVLLDPLWYENRGFKPSELPPWPTPNLQRALTNLNWKPQSNLVEALKETVQYFKGREMNEEPLEVATEGKEKKKLIEEWKEDKEEEKKVIKPTKKNFRMPFNKSLFLTSIALAAIFYAIIWPLIYLGWNIFWLKNNLNLAEENLSKGAFEQSIDKMAQAKQNMTEIRLFWESILSLDKFSLLKENFKGTTSLVKSTDGMVGGSEHLILGIKYLYKGLQAVSGEQTTEPFLEFLSASTELAFANEYFSKAKLELNDKTIFKASVEKKLKELSDVARESRAAVSTLPQIMGVGGKKSYLVLLQNNMELRPGGGFIGSVAHIDFENLKLKKIEVQDIYNIDGNLKIHVEPPKELKEGLEKSDWYLRDSNWEGDFPTSARQAAWFYEKETGLRVDGVVALDLSGMEDLMSILGPVNLADYNEEINSNNLFEKAIAHAEVNFFDGSQAKKSFLTALETALFNKLFFLPSQNWPGITMSLGRSLKEKHLMVYFVDPKLSSFATSQDWTGAMPRPSSDFEDFLSLVEANLGANKVNFYLDRSLNLETTIGKSGELQHTLRVSYTNRSLGETWPGGKYKNRMRVYVPLGAKLVRVLWGEKDITKDVTSFSDYGRTGYSFLIELAPKEQKNLVINYELADKLNVGENETVYKLNIIKQAGILKDPLEWTIHYPINLKVSGEGKTTGPQEYSISSDLSENRRFEIKLTK